MLGRPKAGPVKADWRLEYPAAPSGKETVEPGWGTEKESAAAPAPANPLPPPMGSLGSMETLTGCTGD